MPRPLTVNVALVPALVPADPSVLLRSTFIVVDVVRATTTLSVLFEHGCERVLVASGIAAARVAHADLGRERLLAGESGGVAPEGFDLGNSPAEMSGRDMRGAEVIFATTNGTRALRTCMGGHAVFAGSLRNATAVARAAVAAAHHIPSMPGMDPSNAGGASEALGADYSADITIVCSGRAGNPSYDDTICAGYLVGALERAAGEAGTECRPLEQARIAADLLRYTTGSATIYEALKNSDAGQAVQAVGLGDDLEYCAAIDASRAVPMLEGAYADTDLLMMRDARMQPPDA